VSANTRTTRTLHLVDIENLAGTAYPTSSQVVETMQAYVAAASVSERDHVVMACSPMAARWVGWARPEGSRLVVRQGKDGADLALLEELAEYRHVAARYGRVVIGSGDWIFAEAAACLAAICEVQVVSAAGALSKQLLLAVGHKAITIEADTSMLYGGVVA
jgi:hypothetical protein